MTSPASAAGACDSGAVDSGALDGAVDAAALGAVLPPDGPQAAAMIAIPATMAAKRSCFFIAIVVSSLDPDGVSPIRSQQLVGAVPTGLAGDSGL